MEQLIPRVIFSRGFDYWESGMDVFPGQDMYENFRSYQAALLAEFDRLSVEFNFETLDASADAKLVFAQLQAKVQRILDRDSKKTSFTKVYDQAAAAAGTYGGHPVTLPRETTSKQSDWAFHPVAANLFRENGRNIPEHT